MARARTVPTSARQDRQTKQQQPSGLLKTARGSSLSRLPLLAATGYPAAPLPHGRQDRAPFRRLTSRLPLKRPHIDHSCPRLSRPLPALAWIVRSAYGAARCGKVRRSPAVQTIGRLALRAFVPAVRHRTADHSGNDPTTALLLPLTHPFLQSSGLAAHKPQLHLDVRPPVPRTVPSTLPPSETSKDERRRAPGSRRRSAVGLRSRPARVASSLLVFGHVLLAALRQHRSRHRDLCWRRPRPPHDNTREGIDCIRGPAGI